MPGIAATIARWYTIILNSDFLVLILTQLTGNFKNNFIFDSVILLKDVTFRQTMQWIHKALKKQKLNTWLLEGHLKTDTQKVNFLASFKYFSKRQYTEPLVRKICFFQILRTTACPSKRKRLPAGKILKLPEPYI